MSGRPKLFLTADCMEKLGGLVGRFFTLTVFDSAEELKKASASAEAVILYGEEQLYTALSISADTSAAVLLLTGESDAKILNRCTVGGVLYAPVSDFTKLISPLYAMSVRLAGMESRNDKLRRKLDDSKIVSRAKLLLMSRLGMSEDQAHRYIEKAAMDGCISRREVAVGIIKTYEE